MTLLLLPATEGDCSNMLHSVWQVRLHQVNREGDTNAVYVR